MIRISKQTGSEPHPVNPVNPVSLQTTFMKNTKLILISLAALFVGGLRDAFCTANVEGATGTHAGAFTRRADAAHTATHLVLKQGTDARHVAICGAADRPIGTTQDQPSAAEDIIAVDPLSSGTPGTRKFRCATALAANIDIFTAANGLVRALPGSGGGTAYLVGHTIELAGQVGTSDYLVEAIPCTPVATTIPT